MDKDLLKNGLLFIAVVVALTIFSVVNFKQGINYAMEHCKASVQGNEVYLDIGNDMYVHEIGD